MEPSLGNFIKVWFDLKGSGWEELHASESAWASPQGDYYRIENIPFYAYGYSFADVVRAEPDELSPLTVKQLIKASRHSTIRIVFQNEEDNHVVRERLSQLGCDSEGVNKKYITVDVPEQIDYNPVRQFLQQGEDDGKWEFEESNLYHF